MKTTAKEALYLFLSLGPRELHPESLSELHFLYVSIIAKHLAHQSGSSYHVTALIMYKRGMCLSYKYCNIGERIYLLAGIFTTPFLGAGIIGIIGSIRC